MASQLFHQRFGTVPVVEVHSPGRVNLIGEHVDHALLPVMPAAIDRGIRVAVGPGRGLTAVSAQMSEGRVGWDAGWQRYVAAAAERLGVTEAAVAVDGDLPMASGLSSSSALTVGVVAGLARLTGRTLTDDEVIGHAIDAERSLGVAGGTMDQTVIVAGRAGTLLRIDFVEPSRRSIPMPEEIRLVVASSGTPAPKAGALKDEYNVRVAAGRAAAALLGDRVGADPGRPPALGRLAIEEDVVDLPVEISASSVAGLTGHDPGDIAPHLDPDRPLPVAVVAHHMLAEARRVDDVELALVGGDLSAVGRLLDASHESLGRLGVSTPELDRVVAAMRSAGALGARLTGAGFGGMAVALCRPGVVDPVVGAALVATGGPAFEVRSVDGVGSVAS